MQNFNIGPLGAWSQVAIGEILDFPCPASGFRNVDFDIMAEVPVVVRAVAGQSHWLVAVGEGLLSCKFGTDCSVGIVVMGEPDADVFIKTRADTQVIAESRDPSFTSIEPRPAGPSDEVRRMMHIVKLNEQRRNEALQQAIDAARAGLVPVDPPAAQPPAETPAPAPEGEGNAG